MQRLHVVMLEHRGALHRRPDRTLRLVGETLEHRRPRPRAGWRPVKAHPHQLASQAIGSDRRSARRIPSVDERLDIVDPDPAEYRRRSAVQLEPEQDVLAARAERASCRRDIDRPLERRGRSRRPRDQSQYKIPTGPAGTHDRGVDIACTDTPLPQQPLHVPPPSEREEQMLRLDRRAAEHPRLILSQQDQVVRLVGKEPHRLPIIPQAGR